MKKHVHVLLVEDDPLTQAALEFQLQRFGYQVTVTSSGEEALRRVAEEPVNVVLMDIVLGGHLDGIQTAQRLHEERDLPVVYLSGTSDEDNVRRALATDPLAYVAKPPTPRELQITIELALYRHQTERQLREREARLSAILNTVTSGIVYQSRERGITYLNPRAERILGKRLVDVEGQRLQDLVLLYNEREQRTVGFAEALKQGEDNETIYRLQVSGRPPRYVRLHRQEVLAAQEDSEIISLVDLTDRYETEKRINLLTASFEHLQEAVLITERDASLGTHYILYANPATETITRYPRTDLIHAQLDRVCGPEALATIRETVQRAHDQGTGQECELTCYRQTGDAYLAHWTALPMGLREKGNPCVIFILRDVTRLRRLEEKMRQSQKLEAVGRLADGLAHDFNNIIAIISGLSELLVLQRDQDPKTLRRAQQIHETSQRGAQIIAQLMAFSRRDKEEYGDLDLVETVRRLAPLVRHLLPSSVELVLDLPAQSLPKVPADRTQIEQTIFNLCTNARDAISPRSGRITVGVHPLTLSEAEASRLQPTPKPGEFLALQVRDTGCGMPPEVQAKIFDPFFTTKDVGKGTGLGLSSVYGIVEKHGGAIQVETTVGKGTTFRILLPLDRVEAPRSAPAFQNGTSRPPMPLPGRRVWLYDDGRTLCRSLGSALELRGFSITRVGAGNAGWTAVDIASSYDVALLPGHVPDARDAAEIHRFLVRPLPCLAILLEEPDVALDPSLNGSGPVILEGPPAINNLVRQIESLASARLRP